MMKKIFCELVIQRQSEYIRTPRKYRASVAPIVAAGVTSSPLKAKNDRDFYEKLYVVSNVT